MEKTAIILSDFANGAQKTSSDLSKLAPVARVVNCAEHAFENVSNACMTAEKKFLTEQLCEKKGLSALAKDDKPLVEVNSFLYFPVRYGSLICCMETLRDSRSYLTASDSARR